MNNKLIPFLFVSIFLSVCSCEDKKVIENSNKNEETTFRTYYDSELNINILEDDTTYYSQVNDNNFNNYDHQISRQNELFAIKELDKMSYFGNCVFSPYNISLSYSIMANVADNEVQKELMDYLNTDSNISNKITNDYYRKTINTMTVENAGNDMSFKNKIWVKGHSEIKRSFLSLLNYYNTDIKGIDFYYDKDKVTSEVMAHSNNKNASIIYDDYAGINSIVTNSIFFNKKWKHNYKCFYNEKFFNGTDSITCKKFGLDGIANIYDSFYYIIELPYVDDDYSMYVIYTGFTDIRFSNVLNDINNHGGISNIIKNMTPSYVNFRMPEFSIDNSSPYKASRDYQLGVTLSNISNNPFTINDIYQVCSVKVNCDGTLAEVFNPIETIIPPFTNSPFPPQQDYVIIDIDQPFWFVIRNNKLATILFAGYVSRIL